MALKAVARALIPAPMVRLARRVENTAKLAWAERLPFKTLPLGAPVDRSIFNRTDYASDFELVPAFGEIDGGVCFADRRAIYYLIRHLKPSAVLEIGTHVCASAVYICAALKHNGIGRLTTVDLRDCRRHDVDADFVIADSVNFMRSEIRKYDFIFLDGDHGATTVYREVAAALGILRDGGHILLHDYYAIGRPISGPYLGMKRIMSEAAMHVQTLATSLALVARKPT